MHSYLIVSFLSDLHTTPACILQAGVVCMVSGPRGRLVEVYSLVCMTQFNSYASEFPLLPRSSMHPPAQLGVRLIVCM